MTILLNVDGMMCRHCQGRVERAVSQVHGVDEVTVDLDAKTVKAVGDSLRLDEVIAAIAAAGYQATLIAAD